jgi:predicted TIM-barrel fold metal-dependent hydrolase
MIVDGHCHAGRGDGFTGPSLGRYLRRAAAAGIERTVVFPMFDSDYRAANRALRSIVRRCEPRLIGFAFVNARRDRGRVGDLVREAVEELGFRGIKVHRHDARITREICEAARRWSLPVLYDVMGEVKTIDLFAPQYRDVTFIIPHLGSFADDWRAQRACIDALARHPNVYTDTSGVRYFDLLVDAVRRAGPDKVIFGSDGPWLHPGVELFKVRALGLQPDDEENVLGGNILRILGERGGVNAPWNQDAGHARARAVSAGRGL